MTNKVGHLQHYSDINEGNLQAINTNIKLDDTTDRELTEGITFPGSQNNGRSENVNKHLASCHINENNEKMETSDIRIIQIEEQTNIENHNTLLEDIYLTHAKRPMVSWPDVVPNVLVDGDNRKIESENSHSSEKLQNLKSLIQINIDESKQITSVGKVQNWIKTNAAHQHDQENCK